MNIIAKDFSVVAQERRGAWTARLALGITISLAMLTACQPLRVDTSTGEATGKRQQLQDQREINEASSAEAPNPEVITSARADGERTMPPEQQVKAACDADQGPACLYLAAHLHQGVWGKGRSGEALAILNPRCDRGEGPACALGLQIARMTPTLVTAERERDLLERGCKGGFPHLCMELAALHIPTSLEKARSAWTTACEQREAYACALLEGKWQLPPKDPPTLPGPFRDALEAARMTFTMPYHFKPVPVQENPDLGYQFAMQSEDGNLEIRYAVMPLEPLLKRHRACKPPDCFMANPNLLGGAMSLTTALNISRDEPDGPGSFPVLGVQIEFGADWGLIYNVSPRKTFAPAHQHGQLITLHRDDLADATIVLLFNQREHLEPAWSAAFHALRFEAPLVPRDVKPVVLSPPVRVR